jgi:uncharacterized protein (TIGR02118 family)
MLAADVLEGSLMPKLIVLYPPPVDVAEFERRYNLEHAPMVRDKIPGLKKFVAARVLGAPAGTAPFQRVAELYFDSSEALQSGMASAEGQAAVAHAGEISTGGAPVVLIAEDD